MGVCLWKAGSVLYLVRKPSDRLERTVEVEKSGVVMELLKEFIFRKPGIVGETHSSIGATDNGRLVINH